MNNTISGYHALSKCRKAGLSADLLGNFCTVKCTAIVARQKQDIVTY